jgi:hypothetical protein
MYFIVQGAGAKRGPYTDSEIASMLQGGLLSRSDELESAETNVRLSVGSLVDSLGETSFEPDAPASDSGLPPVIPGSAPSSSEGIPTDRPYGSEAGGPPPQLDFDWMQNRAEPITSPKNRMLVGILIAATLCFCPLFLLPAAFGPFFSQGSIPGNTRDYPRALQNSGRALMIYARDWDDKFPANLREGELWKDSVREYASEFGPGPFALEDDDTISVNPNLAGLRATEVLLPQETILVYIQSPKLDDTALVMTVDGRTYVVRSADLDKSIHSKIFNLPQPLSRIR